MKNEGIYSALTQFLTPLNIKLLLLLSEGPKTKSQLYQLNSNVNNTIVKEALDGLQQSGFVVGGEMRGAPYRLSIPGVSIVSWLQEGVTLL